MCWLIAAGLGNLAVPQLEHVVATHSRAFLPADAPSSVAAARSAQQMGGGGTGDNLNYVVLERGNGIVTADREYYGRLIDALRADRTHVQAVTDLWSDPLTAAAAVSDDGAAAYVMVRLAGNLGTAQAGSAVEALRGTVDGLSPPPGLQVYVTGPGATIADESARSTADACHHRRPPSADHWQLLLIVDRLGADRCLSRWSPSASHSEWPARSSRHWVPADVVEVSIFSAG
ncbi:MMPL family transporter, partial [Mycolicibacterium insubricum]|uniref:MMPL family transporter n=1 Tax=Mycolicibacterium insubricum TaxID=444597 RepID=UPI0021F340BD